MYSIFYMLIKYKILKIFIGRFKLQIYFNEDISSRKIICQEFKTIFRGN